MSAPKFAIGTRKLRYDFLPPPGIPGFVRREQVLWLPNGLVYAINSTNFFTIKNTVSTWQATKSDLGEKSCNSWFLGLCLYTYDELD